jgi:hypothetical protein
MAPAAGIVVECWPQASITRTGIQYAFDFDELTKPVLKKRELLRRQSGNRTAGANRGAARTRVFCRVAALATAL